MTKWRIITFYNNESINKLKNTLTIGLLLLLAACKNEASFQSNVTVNAGSKNEPGFEELIVSSSDEKDTLYYLKVPFVKRPAVSKFKDGLGMEAEVLREIAHGVVSCAISFQDKGDPDKTAYDPEKKAYYSNADFTPSPFAPPPIILDSIKNDSDFILVTPGFGYGNKASHRNIQLAEIKDKLKLISIYERDEHPSMVFNVFKPELVKASKDGKGFFYKSTLITSDSIYSSRTTINQ
jgi:hypothetical protein